jgi:lysophospholipase L1-like esterase
MRSGQRSRCAWRLLTVLIAFWLLLPASPRAAEAAQLACGPFAGALSPQPRQLTRPPQRMAEIEAEASARSFPVVFLGDSLTQLWDRETWQRYFTGFPALNAGVGGDRTDHLLWRLENGILNRLHPKLIVLQIGTNDLTLERSPALVAEGVRTILLRLQKRWPQALILLESLWPRDDRPDQRQKAEDVNALIARCAGGAVTYADFSKVLLDPSGQLVAAAYQPDKLHLGRAGYEKISPAIAEKIQQLLGPRTERGVSSSGAAQRF